MLFVNVHSLFMILMNNIYISIFISIFIAQWNLIMSYKNSLVEKNIIREVNRDKGK